MNAPPKTYTEPQEAFQELLFWGLYNSWIELNFCQVREYPRTCMLTYADSIHGNRQCTTLVQNHKIMVVENLRRNWQKYDGYWKHNLIPIPLLILYKIFILWSGIFFQNYFFGGGNYFFSYLFLPLLLLLLLLLLVFLLLVLVFLLLLFLLLLVLLLLLLLLPLLLLLLLFLFLYLLLLLCTFVSATFCLFIIFFAFVLYCFFFVFIFIL